MNTDVREALASVRRTVLENGVVVVTEHVPAGLASAFALLTRQGSRDERPAENGLSHFLEHFVFRGTLPWAHRPEGRTQLDIAQETDLLGGEVDAWTGRESTSYGAEVAADMLPRAIRLTCDLVGRPALPPDELERERLVIREEMRGYEDDPAERAFMQASASWWPRHPLGRRIEGSARTVERFTHADVEAFCRRKHAGANLIACAAGPLAHDEVVALVREGLGDLPRKAPSRGPKAPEPVRGIKLERRLRLEQVQLLLTLPGLENTSRDLPALVVLACALGGGASSRLWQVIREQEGLAYSISLEHEAYRDCGRLAFHAVVSPGNVARVLALFVEQCRVVRERPLPGDEFERARQGLRSAMVLDMQTPADRLAGLSWGEMVFGRPVPLEERLARLMAVTPEEVRAVAEKLLGDPRRQLTLVGPLRDPVDDALLGP